MKVKEERRRESERSRYPSESIVCIDGDALGTTVRVITSTLATMVKADSIPLFTSHE